MIFSRSLVLVIVLMISFASCVPREAVKPPPRPAKIALVLGAGGSRGFAHIGVLKVLESNNIPIHMIVGTSAGSFVGSLYAYGFNAFQLQKMSFSIEKGDIIDLAIPDNGFIRGEKLEEYINKTLNNTPMEKLRIPFHAVTADIQNGNEVVFGQGNTGKAVRASCSIPGVFMPVIISDRMYVDGGIASPVPVDAAKRLGADMVIAVDISSNTGSKKPEGAIETIMQSINFMYSKLASLQLTRADVIIRPRVGNMVSSDFSKKHDAVLEGEKAALEMLPYINEIIARLRQEGRLGQ